MGEAKRFRRSIGRNPSARESRGDAKVIGSHGAIVGKRGISAAHLNSGDGVVEVGAPGRDEDPPKAKDTGCSNDRRGLRDARSVM